MKILNVLVSVMMTALCMESGLVYGQENPSESYSRRYNLIVSKLGYAGVGVETVLKQWQAVDSLNVDMLAAWFNYYYTKSQTTEVVVKPQKKYLGADPVLSLKDSTGTDIYYFQEVFYDDDLFSDGMKYLDKAIKVSPDRIDLRFTKVAALMSYEKGLITSEEFRKDIRSMIRHTVSDEQIDSAWNSFLVGVPTYKLELLH